MITEDSLSENNENPINEEVLNENISENQADSDAEIPVEIPEKNQIAENDFQSEEVSAEEQSAESSDETAEQTFETVTEEESQHEEEVADLSLPEILKEMESIINKDEAGSHFRKFNQLKEQANHFIHDETEDKKNEFVAQGNAEEDFSFQHPLLSKLSGFINIFRGKNEEYTKKQEETHGKNLEIRQNIIEKLKNLYTNTEAGTNLFKAIREVKEEWKNAGQVAKTEFKLLNNNYFHHLNQFYQMLDMNKEYMEQEYAHNLEKRQHIIERAK